MAIKIWGGGVGEFSFFFIRRKKRSLVIKTDPTRKLARMKEKFKKLRLLQKIVSNGSCETRYVEEEAGGEGQVTGCEGHTVADEVRLLQTATSPQKHDTANHS